MPAKYLTVDEAAALLGLTRRALYLRVHRGLVPHIKWGRLVRFDPRDLDRMMQDNRVEAWAETGA
jgi:excisionase family DNA binding protein